MFLITACGGEADDEGDATGADTNASTDAGSGDGSETDTGADGSVYGPCSNAVECFENYEDPSCVAPGDGSLKGFCTDACDSAGECAPSPGGTATIDCLDVYGTGPVCVVLCEGSAACPSPMQCKEVATNAGVLSMCFWPG